ncbi:MAG: hypothetical protein AAES65_18385 [Candidatus Thiodiazotropha sp. (ex. Lucinoma kazani)]
MSDVRKHVNIPPVESPSLPCLSIDANVCRNPACDNFGVSELLFDSGSNGRHLLIPAGISPRMIDNLRILCREVSLVGKDMPVRMQGKRVRT